MDLKQLRYAVAVADERHFGRAARREHVAQSAISLQIARLEEDLGTELFERTSRDVRLTDAGRVFVERARSTLRRLSGAADLVGRATSGDIRVGFVGPGVDDWFVEIAALYHQRRPDSRVLPRDVLFDAVDGGLVEGTTDAAFLVSLSTSPTPEARSEVLYRQPSQLLVPEGHPYAGRTDVSFAEVDPRDLMMSTSSVLRQRGPSRFPLASTTEELYEYVALGALAVAPLSLSTRYSRAGVAVVPLVDGPTYQHVLAWKDNGREVVTAFVDAARAVARRRRARERERQRELGSAGDTGA